MGSFPASDCAIWSLEKFCSNPGDAMSGMVGDDRAAAFSAAIIDSGRLLERSEACDGGRLCHDRGDREGAMPLDGDVNVRLVRLMSESKGKSFSLVGELEVEYSRVRSIASACDLSEKAISISSECGLTSEPLDGCCAM